MERTIIHVLAGVCFLHPTPRPLTSATSPPDPPCLHTYESLSVFGSDDCPMPTIHTDSYSQPSLPITTQL